MLHYSPISSTHSLNTVQVVCRSPWTCNFTSFTAASNVLNIRKAQQEIQSVLYYCYSSISRLHVRRCITWTSVSYLTEHDKNGVYQSVNIDVPIEYLFAIVYDDRHINSVITVLRSKLHIEKNPRNLMHYNSTFLSKSRN